MNKEKKSLIILLGVSILLIIIAIIVYPKLVKKYEDEKINIKNNVNTNEVQNISKNKAKNFIVYNENGDKVTLNDFDKPMIINFWTTWCGYCKEEMPYFNEMYEKEKDNIEFLMINGTDYSETKEKALKYVNDNKYSFKIYFDEKNSARDVYNITGYPTTIFINKEKEIVKIEPGLITKEKLLNMVDKIKE